MRGEVMFDRLFWLESASLANRHQRLKSKKKIRDLGSQSTMEELADKRRGLKSGRFTLGTLRSYWT